MSSVRHDIVIEPSGLHSWSWYVKVTPTDPRPPRAPEPMWWVADRGVALTRRAAQRRADRALRRDLRVRAR